MKPLSDRLQWMFDNNYMDWDVVSDAIQLAKSVESAPARTVLYMHQAGGLVCYVSLPENMAGQRVALVPLPQQSES